MAYATETRIINAPVGNRLSNLFTSISERFAAYKTYRKTRIELDALNDRELADLGIARGSIHEIATFAAYGQN